MLKRAGWWRGKGGVVAGEGWRWRGKGAEDTKERVMDGNMTRERKEAGSDEEERRTVNQRFFARRFVPASHLFTSTISFGSGSSPSRY